MIDVLIFAADGAKPKAFGMDATVWVSIAMAVFLAILVWKKVPGMIAGMLDSKIAGIRASLDEAATLRREAEALRAEYQAKLDRAEGEAADIRAQAENEAQAMLAKAKADTAALVARRKGMANDRIAAAEAAAVADVQAAAARGAVAAAEALIAARHGADADQALVDRAIKGLA